MHDTLRKKLIKTKNIAGLPAIVLLSTFVQFVGINGYSLGFDESYSVYVAHLPLSKLLVYDAKDVHPPLFYVFLKVWIHLFGDSALAVRSMSAICMVLCVLVGFALIKELSNRRAAYVAALFVALGPFAVRYGHEARMYAPMAFLVLLATYALVMTLHAKISKTAGATIYTIAMTAAVYTHYYSFFVLPAHWIMTTALRNETFTFVGFWKVLKKEKWWLISLLVITACFVPWLPYAIGQFTKVEGGFWLPPVHWYTILGTFSNFTSYGSITRAAAWTTGLFFALLFIAIFLVRDALRRAILAKQTVVTLVLLILITPLIVVIVSIGRSVYYDRYFMVGAVFYYLLLGTIFAQHYPARWHRRLRTGGLALALILFVVGIVRVDQPQYANIQSLMKNVQTLSHGRDYEVVVADHTLYYQVDYYDIGKRAAGITRSAYLSGYGSMAPLGQAGVISSLPTERGAVWIVNDSNECGVNLPSSWRQINKTSTSFGVHAWEYQT